MGIFSENDTGNRCYYCTWADNAEAEINDLKSKLTNNKTITTCASAILHYGEKSQIEMIIEECAELIVALQKYKRGGCNQAQDAAVVTELADVFIMVQQGSMMFNEYAVKAEIDRKIDRLEKRMEEGK